MFIEHLCLLRYVLMKVFLLGLLVSHIKIVYNWHISFSAYIVEKLILFFLRVEVLENAFMSFVKTWLK